MCTSFYCLARNSHICITVVSFSFNVVCLVGFLSNTCTRNDCSKIIASRVTLYIFIQYLFASIPPSSTKPNTQFQSSYVVTPAMLIHTAPLTAPFPVYLQETYQCITCTLPPRITATTGTGFKSIQDVARDCQ